MRALEMDPIFPSPPSFAAEPRRNLAAFWLLGLFNNASYVIMIAGANSISSAAVGLVYLCAVLPGVILKASAPYWFHHVNYSTRILAGAALMGGSYTTVALSPHRGMQLLGVVLASMQSSLGEASCLALSSHYSSRSAITAWSSGTGFAGVFGYAWVALLHVVGKWSFKATLLSAWVTVVCWLTVYFCLLEPPEARTKEVKRLVLADGQLVEAAMEAFGGESDDDSARAADAYYFSTTTQRPEADRTGGTGGGDGRSSRGKIGNPGYYQDNRGHEGHGEEEDDALLERANEHTSALSGRSSVGEGSVPRSSREDTDGGTRRAAKSAVKMTTKERFIQVLRLWPYTVPLFAVYFAEYAMQSGAWTAMGFPVTDITARHTFYVYANWSYQVGVFISRSSGTLWQAKRGALWIMPAMQVGMLAFFLANAVEKWWYNWSLLAPCFFTGLLGGAVYVNAFTLISREVEPRLREFSLAAASVADGLGVALADVSGVLIQGCLFKANGLPGADFKC